MPASDVIKQLRAVINNRPPVATGVLPVPRDACSLFYKHGGDVRFVDFTSATPADLAALSAACEAATFGVDDRDVLDETYRKAGKMDRAHFASRLEEEVPKILSAIRPVLFTDGEEKTNIRAELYKLNVYGEGAFFKSHQDTPRGKTMFGSLVIAYPTPHAGGALRFSKGDKTWSLDSATMLAEQREPAIAYAVFFSDTEHEVLPVTAGHRITITYNLYLAPGLGEEDESVAPVGSAIAAEVKNDEATLGSMLQGLLDDAAFLPKGGLMGFGLKYQYAVADRTTGSFADVAGRLKGVDAAVVRACARLGLATQIKALAQADAHDSGWLLDDVPQLKYCYDEEHDAYVENDLSNGILVRAVDDDEEEADGMPDCDPIGMGDRFVWVTRANKNARTGTQTYATYGNSPSAGEFYADLCFVAHVGRPGSRTNAVKIPKFRRDEYYEWAMVSSDKE